MGDPGYFYGMLYLEASGRARTLPQDHPAPVAERPHKVAQDFSPGSATEKMEVSPVGTTEAPREFETKRIGSIATRPRKERKDGALAVVR